VETSGVVEGATLELAPFAGGELSALLVGARHHRDVNFAKAYDAATQLGLVPIAYTGAIDADFMVVRGHWRLISHDPLHGGFVMRRISSNGVFALKGRQEMRVDTPARLASIAKLRVIRPRRPRPKLSLKGE
jgi:hypothetical protein